GKRPRQPAEELLALCTATAGGHVASQPRDAFAAEAARHTSLQLDPAPAFRRQRCAHLDFERGAGGESVGYDALEPLPVLGMDPVAELGERVEAPGGGRA